MDKTEESLKLKNKVDSSNLSETVRQILLASIMDPKGVSLPAMPVILVNPQNNPITLDGSAGIALYNPLSGLWEKQVTASKFVTLGLTTAAGDTAIWAANATKKIRILGYTIALAAGTTAAAGSTITIKDNATVIFNHALAGAALAAPGVPVIVANVVLPGNGYLCAAINTAVNLNLSTVLAVGGVTVNMWGTEETP